MPLALNPLLTPMEAESVSELPLGAGWQYEPKWDGFRCLAFRDGERVSLRSKSGQSLDRYFPEIVGAVRAIKARQFALDGELVIPVRVGLSFNDLLQRIHPAASRVHKLATATTAWLILFDLLADASGRALIERPLRERRVELEAFARKYFISQDVIRLSPATTAIATARKWYSAVGRSLDGLIAKRLDAEYRAGERTAMVKIKRQRTADCVVGGFRYAEKKRVIGSLLLGLYDDQGLLHHVGFCSGIKATERSALTKKLESAADGSGFTGRAPGGPSRWATKRSTEWVPLEPRWVVEVSFDHVTGDRFRHGTRLLRWRPDKAPAQCTLAS